MSVPVNLLKPDQRFWYAKLVLSAILADGEIDSAEVDFLRGVIGVVQAPELKANLMQYVQAKKPPEVNEPPSKIPDQVLAAIFAELILICISDHDFAEEEEAFLRKVADVMLLTEPFYRSMMAWLNEGLSWKKAQAELLPAELGINPGEVPLKDFDSEQKFWYAKLVIITLMLDGQVDEMELSFMKMAISFCEEDHQKKKLMAFVKNRLSPNLEEPYGFSRSQLVAVFVSILQIVTANESMTYKEQTYLKQLSDLCGFDKALFDRLINWATQGMNWKANKNGLIQRVRRKT
ncbi:MAG: hypothetical protein A2508_09585 [Candidatus Lambdaproteobacteria bacterium RIFOXYD12_FULL_49_8]|uniref:Co-chaperone DjlA N-terminal domain-containing protein n=1 Tax=Candidatus Lambdaproteobacteria bacterium RIFOXYD2_FULL_50_16 TaxID=1817772 RepID=A0A1F6GF49_9PROT|nr:MAG: hypothetical protein A2527_04095 [Candidatus Lambdaproteobacteria bacterium RIFOXYD2_FULL_50_16]OGG97994.1 MAG: hypothetical protein A2508_09585 [Candidatus Lambdaproteobacteria bacterium RIFOXYD12_FULL_49_8]